MLESQARCHATIRTNHKTKKNNNKKKILYSSGLSKGTKKWQHERKERTVRT